MYVWDEICVSIWVWLHSLAYNISGCALILRDVNYCLGLQFIILIKLPYKNTYKTIFCFKKYFITILRFLFWVKRIPLKQELLQLVECECICKTHNRCLLCIISCSLILRLWLVWIVEIMYWVMPKRSFLLFSILNGKISIEMNRMILSI